MSEERKALVLASLSVIFWSTVATAFKIALTYVDSSKLLVLASTTASIILLIVLVLTGKLSILCELNFKFFFRSALIGFLNPFLYYLVLFKAYSLLPAQEALSLNYTWAIVLTILTNIFLKKKVNFFSYISLLVSFTGVLIILSKGSIVSLRPSNPYGAFLAMSSSIIWGVSWLVNIMSKLDDEVRLFLNFSFGAFFGWIYLFVNENVQVPNFCALLPIIYVGVFEMGITFILWNKALKMAINPAKVNNLIYLSPVISLAFIGLILKEVISFFSILGIFLIIAGILLQSSIPFLFKMKRT